MLSIAYSRNQYEGECPAQIQVLNIVLFRFLTAILYNTDAILIFGINRCVMVVVNEDHMTSIPL